jgi:hypothetical protein
MKTFLTYKTKELVDNSNKYYSINESKDLVKILRDSKFGRPTHVKLPKELGILPETLGLIVGEGYVGDRSFVFANSNENAVDLVLGFLKQFKVPIRIYLEVSTKNTPKAFVKKSKEFWENHLKIKLNRVRKREEFNNITKHGTIHLCMNGKIISEVIKNLVIKSKKKVEEDKEFSVGYLKGIFAAEGNVNAKKTTNCLYMVRISSKKQDERDHYKRCLKSAGLNIYCRDMPSVSKEEGKQKGWKSDKGRAGCVIISRWENFVKILMLDLLGINSEKREKFIRGFINNKFTKQFLDFENFINKKFIMKDAQLYFDFKGRHLNRLLTLHKLGYASRENINNKFEYKLTEKYMDLYKKIKSELKLFQITPLLNS